MATLGCAMPRFAPGPSCVSYIARPGRAFGLTHSSTRGRWFGISTLNVDETTASLISEANQTLALTVPDSHFTTLPQAAHSLHVPAKLRTQPRRAGIGLARAQLKTGPERPQTFERANRGSRLRREPVAQHLHQSEQRDRASVLHRDENDHQFKDASLCQAWWA